MHDVATCQTCQRQNVRIEYTHSAPRQYRIVCIGCGYATPYAVNLNDCAPFMDWTPARLSRPATA